MEAAHWISSIAAALLTLATITQAAAIEAEEARRTQRESGGTTFIDIRPSREYREEHIPGSINVPAALCPAKRLPPLGRVIVVGDGIDVAITARATEILNEKAGIQAEQLQGGLDRWRALGLPTTKEPGMSTEKLPRLTYEQLARAAGDNPDLVIVDLRRRRRAGETGTSSLKDLFPGVPVVRSAFEDNRSNRTEHRSLYILVDDLDGRSEEHGRRLRAAGIRRFRILSGGETALARRGKSGREKEVFSIEGESLTEKP